VVPAQRSREAAAALAAAGVPVEAIYPPGLDHSIDAAAAAAGLAFLRGALAAVPGA
jgi:phospholipase/carboxylesterase